jgi:hypothetical protein
VSPFLDGTDPRVVALGALLILGCFAAIRWLWGAP